MQSYYGFDRIKGQPCVKNGQASKKMITADQQYIIKVVLENVLNLNFGRCIK